MRKFFPFLILSLALVLRIAAPLHAAIEKDLGQNLAYFRVTDARVDKSALTSAIEKHPALVIDLRNLDTEIDFIATLHNALAQKPTANAARFVLVNASTSPAVRAVFDDASLLSVITIGPKSKLIGADIPVATTTEEETRALAALTNGTAVEKLITDPLEKRRYDEAKLVQDHANGVTPSDSDLPADAEDETVTNEPANGKKTKTTEKKTEQPPRDLVLERAVQLHRALLALKKL